MRSPYTQSPQDAFIIVQGCTGIALTALIWYRPLRPRVATWLFAAAIWIVATIPEATDFFRSIGWGVPPSALGTTLRAGAAVAAIAFLVARPHWIGVLGVLGVFASSWLVKNVTESDLELCALHMAWLGALLGLHQLVGDRESEPPPVERPPESTYFVQDLGLALLAMLLAAIVSSELLMRSCDSADEWAYTYQAAVFAKLRAYGETPRCMEAFRSFWVFSAGGRNFSQYTPGWPIFMAPFVPFRAVWLAAPASLGVLVAGVARLARRAARGAFGGRSREVEAAGVAAALATMTASTMLINGGSRFGHIFVGACFAWSIEALAVLTTPPLDARSQWKWGAFLGLTSSWMLATRPTDGATLGVGLALYFVYAALRMRVPWRGFVATAAAFLAFGGLTLVLLRLQLGKWFTTGYSLTLDYYPWAKFSLSTPKLSEVRWGVPLATGSYCWWPLCPALGLAGLVAALRGEGRRVGFMLALGLAPLLAFYSWSTFGRGIDFGYGPRYELPAIVPMAVGTGVVLAPLWVAARTHVHARRALAIGGPVTLFIAAFAIGIVRLAPLVYPLNRVDLVQRNSVFEAARAAHIDNAIVWLEPHTASSDPLDLTQNYPLELYPAPPVLYAIDRGPEARACVRSMYPHRTQYHTEGTSVVTLVRERE